MTSEKQTLANRANAAKSTGPKSPETKAISCMNALRHGVTGQVNLMPDEDRAAHDKFCAAIGESLAPEGALEIQFAQAVAEDNWRMNRGRAIETNIFAIGSFGPGFPGNPDTMTFGTACLDINNPVVRPYPLDSEARTTVVVSRSSPPRPINSSFSPCICSAPTATCRKPSTASPPSKPTVKPAARMHWKKLPSSMNLPKRTVRLRTPICPLVRPYPGRCRIKDAK